MTQRRALHAWVSILISVAVLAAASSESAAAGLASAWVEGYKARTRLLAGGAKRGGPSAVMAFIEIDLPDGWKTYWRSPGDAGGLPPRFDWAKSANLASATVLYPAPTLMTDKSGNTYGYAGGVIFPVQISAGDSARPVRLAVALQFGICKDICVPVDAELALEIPAGVQEKAPAAAVEALDQVPRTAQERRPEDPILKRVDVHLGGAAPRLVLEAQFPGHEQRADIFLEAPDGLYVPLPVRTADRGGGHFIFEAELGHDADLAALTGKPITATLVGDKGASVTTFSLQ